MTATCQADIHNLERAHYQTSDTVNNSDERLTKSALSRVDKVCLESGNRHRYQQRRLQRDSHQGTHVPGQSMPCRSLSDGHLDYRPTETYESATKHLSGIANEVH